MIFDAFLFHNELDLLELRLETLSRAVDRFVVVECNWTHQGDPKSFRFDLVDPRWELFADRIDHVRVTAMPPDRRPEALEPFHRECLLRGLEEADEGDIVMVSDLDEIPSPAAVSAYFAQDAEIVAVEQSLYYYWINCRMCQCTGTRISTVRAAREWGPQRLRHHPEPLATLRSEGEPNWGGWHFSYLGGASAIREKTRAFMHPGCAAQQFMSDANLAKCLATGADLYGRGRGRLVEIDGTWPEPVLRNPELFDKWIWERT